MSVKCLPSKLCWEAYKVIMYILDNQNDGKPDELQMGKSSLLELR